MRILYDLLQKLSVITINKSWSKNTEARRIKHKYNSEGSTVCVWNYVYSAKHYDQIKFRNVNNECPLYKLDGIEKRAFISHI